MPWSPEKRNVGQPIPIIFYLPESVVDKLVLLQLAKYFLVLMAGKKILHLEVASFPCTIKYDGVLLGWFST